MCIAVILRGKVKASIRSCIHVWQNTIFYYHCLISIILVTNDINKWDKKFAKISIMIMEAVMKMVIHNMIILMIY